MSQPQRPATPPKPPAAGPATLVGRDAELALLHGLLTEAQQDGRALMLSGEAGAGKTALLNAAVDTAARLGQRTVQVAGVEFEADIAYAGLNQVLIPLRAEFEELPDRYRQALEVALGLDEGPAVNTLLISTAVLELLRLASGEQPLLLVVDDLQWLDRPSAAVLAFVVRRLTGSRLRVLVACRPGAGDLFESHLVPEIEVGALDLDAAKRLLTGRLPDLSEPVRSRLLAEAQGNPLALLELPATLSAAQLAALAALPAVLPLSRKLLALFAARISDLPARTRALLLLAVLDGNGQLHTLRTALSVGQLVPDLLEVVDAAERSGLVRVAQDGPHLEFRHPLIRSAVVELASAGERRAAHQALAAAWAASPERRAWHLAQAAIGPDEEVAQLLEQSAHRILRRGDAVGAVTALTRAADLSPEPARRSLRLAEAAYVGADVTGQLHSASTLLEEARRIDPQVTRSWQAAVITAHILFYRDGDVDTAHRLLVQALEERTGDFAADDELLLGALHTLLMICWSAGRPQLWPPFHAALARITPQPPAILTVCGQSVADPVRTPPQAVRQLEELIRQLPGEHESTRIIRVGLAAVNLHRTSDCREAYDRVQRDAREGGAITSGIKAMAIMSTEDFWTGRWDEAHDKAQEALAYCESHGYRFLVCTAQYTLGLLAAATGDEQTALSLGDDLNSWAAPRNNLALVRHAVHIRLLTALGAGRYEDAYQHAISISPPGTLPSHVPHAVLIGLDLVEAAVRTDRHTEAAAHAKALHEAGIAALSPRPALFTAVAAALTAPDETAGDLFEQALSLPGTERWPLDVARTHLLYGQWLRRTRSATQARVHLAAAQQTFQRLGAEPWAERAAQELRAAGHTPTRTSTGDAGGSRLTAREQEIAALAATGLSNKQIGERLFLSPRTVGYHLHQVFPKLNITSRSALRDALTRIENNDE